MTVSPLASDDLTSSFEQSTTEPAVSTRPPHTGGLWGQDYLTLTATESPYIVSQLLPVSGMLNIYAPPKVGKSLGALQIAAAIAGGEPTIWGYPIHQHGPALYVQLDNPQATWQAKVRDASRLGYDVSRVMFTDKQMKQIPYPFSILAERELLGRGWAWLKSCVRDFGPFTLVVLDTLRETFEGNENDSRVMKALIDGVQDAIAPAALILVSHAKKPNETIPDTLLSGNRGSSAVAGRMDCILRMSSHGASSISWVSRTSEGEVTHPMLRTRAGQYALPDNVVTCHQEYGGFWERAGDLEIEAIHAVLADFPDLSGEALLERLAGSVGLEGIELTRRVQRALALRR